MQDNKSQFQKKIDRLFTYFDVYTEEALAKKLHTTRSAVSQWKFKKRLPEKIRIKYNKIIEGKGETINVKNKDIPVVKEGSKVEMGADYIIELQKDKIETQAQEIINLKEENNTIKQNTYPIQSSEWSTLDFDFFSDVRISFLPFKRCVTKMNGDGVNQLAKRLGLSEDQLLNEYFSIGNWHVFHEHPVDNIVAPNNLKELKELSINMPSLFNSLKTLIGEHYFRQVIIYQHNDIIVPSVCYMKINWLSNPVKAECKTKFFTD